MKAVQDIIVRPVITENSMMMIEAKKYVFEVAKDATKPEIAKAVAEMFGVEVDCVNTINMKKKPKRMGYNRGYTKAWKKAILTLKADYKTIEFFDGMM